MNNLPESESEPSPNKVVLSRYYAHLRQKYHSSNAPCQTNFAFLTSTEEKEAIAIALAGDNKDAFLNGDEQNAPSVEALIRAEEKGTTPNWDYPWATSPHYKATDSIEMISARDEFARKEYFEQHHDIKAADYDMQKAKALKIARDYPEIVKAQWERRCREAGFADKVGTRLAWNFYPIPLKPWEVVPVWIVALLINLSALAGLMILSYLLAFSMAILVAFLLVTIRTIWARIVGKS